MSGTLTTLRDSLGTMEDAAEVRGWKGAVARLCRIAGDAHGGGLREDAAALRKAADELGELHGPAPSRSDLDAALDALGIEFLVEQWEVARGQRS